MRQITLIESSEDSPRLDERQNIRALLGQAPADGYTLDDVRLANRVLDKVEAGPEIFLEEEEWRFLTGRLDKARWTFAHPQIVEMVDKVKGAKLVKTQPSG